jgi:hypothetical protein
METMIKNLMNDIVHRWTTYSASSMRWTVATVVCAMPILAGPLTEAIPDYYAITPTPVQEEIQATRSTWLGEVMPASEVRVVTYSPIDQPYEFSTFEDSPLTTVRLLVFRSWDRTYERWPAFAPIGLIFAVAGAYAGARAALVDVRFLKTRVISAWRRIHERPAVQ